MWPIYNETATLERFLIWPNRIFATIWNAISALNYDVSFPINQVSAGHLDFICLFKLLLKARSSGPSGYSFNPVWWVHFPQTHFPITSLKFWLLDFFLSWLWWLEKKSRPNAKKGHQKGVNFQKVLFWVQLGSLHFIWAYLTNDCAYKGPKVVIGKGTSSAFQWILLEPF